MLLLQLGVATTRIKLTMCFASHLFFMAHCAGAKTINVEMMKAAAMALELAKAPVTEQLKAYPNHDNLAYGPESIIPKPLDARLLETVSDAVTQAI